MRFVASSGYFYTAVGIGIVGAHATKNLTSADFERAGAAFCARPWADVGTADPYASGYCFGSAYVPSLLGAFGLAGDDQLVEYAGSIGQDTVRCAGRSDAP